MPAQRLSTIRVEKPWGRTRLWPGFADPGPNEPPIGEIWFDQPGADPELLVKYLFTSERLSIQVHPDDDAARAAGHPRGKEEAWLILAAEPTSTIALGLKHKVTRDALRAAALDGSIESLMHWQRVKAGDVIYSTAGTVHAIGAGITLIEIQQNVDLTYRLYDYGRPRELHLDAGIAVADPSPFVAPDTADPAGRILAQGRKFVIERWTGNRECDVDQPDDRPGLLVPVSGTGTVGDAIWQAGECWSVTGAATIRLDPGADALFAYPGPDPLPRAC